VGKHVARRTSATLDDVEGAIILNEYVGRRSTRLPGEFAWHPPSCLGGGIEDGSELLQEILGESSACKGAGADGLG